MGSLVASSMREFLSLRPAPKPEDPWALLTDERFSRGRDWLTLRALRPLVEESNISGPVYAA
jgi:hypothetical protein